MKKEYRDSKALKELIKLKELKELLGWFGWTMLDLGTPIDSLSDEVDELLSRKVSDTNTVGIILFGTPQDANLALKKDNWEDLLINSLKYFKNNNIWDKGE